VKKYSYDPKISIGPGLPTRVVVTGFNPLTAEVKIRSLLSSYGDISEFENKTDPTTGIFLGVCSVTYRDRSASKRDSGSKATDAARSAEKQGSGQRIDQVAVKIETDREGMKCRKYIDKILKVKRAEQAKQSRDDSIRRPQLPTTPIGSVAPPPNAPKGPSGRGMAMLPPPVGPRVAIPPRPAAHSLVEIAPVLPSLKRKPYLYLSHNYVPVLGTTIAHLKKRLKAYDFKDVRCDKTGYYIVFEDSRRGEEETHRCFNEVNLFPLFTYVMNFEEHQYGNPNYERSPSPERMAAQNREKEERKGIKREDELAFEAEKKERAENLDPVKAALELLGPELKATILKEIKEKIAVPAIYNSLDPDRHVDKRKKLNIPDPRDAAIQRPLLPLAGQLSPFHGTSKPGFVNKKPFSKEKQRTRREELRASVNVYDERRKRPVPSNRARPIVPLHRRLQDFREEEESDDERHTILTRGSEDPESHPQSEVGVSPARIEVDDDGLPTPKSKRRRTEAGWGGVDSEDEGLEHLSTRGTLAHLAGKEPEDMAMRELEQLLNVLPYKSSLRQRAATEIKLRHKLKQDDQLFGLVPVDVESASAAGDDMELAEATPEPLDALAKKKKAAAAKPKRKTKKQILEEQAAARADAKAEEQAMKTLEKEEAPTPPVVVEPEEDEPRAEVEWSVSREKPRRTVEDDPDIVLDIDGWQHLLKDTEDVKLLTEVLQARKAANIGEAAMWAYHQKQIKQLMLGGSSGIVKKQAKIEGYYVPNSTGSARTEGTKKINQVEKSKYLPHRIRVQKAREAREQEAKDDPVAAIEAAKVAAAAKIASTATSRSNRANNRRLVNDINTQKQALGADTDALKFNQLKKRKKLVRFDRSAIHNWGLYAEENIAGNDMIIEYVGEKVRQRVADLREINYQKQGIGSSYLFRIDEDTVVDATKKGGIARFINHSCMPNCTAKIIKVDGTKRIVIYALRDSGKSKLASNFRTNCRMLTPLLDEELTYDYKFEREINSDDRIPCLCGSVACKGFLN
jgi:histone-lysine N-methyltransferase SETD1